MKPIRLSPSNLERYAMCPGAYWLEQDLPYQQSAAGDEGKLLHAVLAGMASEEQKSSLNRNQKHDLDICRREARALHEQVFGTVSGLDGWMHEARLVATLEDGVLLSGIVDYYAFKDDKALIIDWKFGRGELTEAARNPQTRAYAVLVDAGVDGLQGKTSITCALIQPRVAVDERVTATVYEPADIEQARSELLDIAAGIRFAGDQRAPGPTQCRYCKALGTDRCPESADTARQLAPLTLGDVMPTPDRLAQVLDICTVAEHVIERYRDYATEFIEAGGVIPGWALVPGNNVRKLKDIDAAWKAAQDVLAPEEFMSACSVSVTKLEAKMADKRGCKKNETRANFDSIMGDAITREQNAPSLKRVEKQLTLMGGQPK